MTIAPTSGYSPRQLVKSVLDELKAKLPHRYGRSSSLVLAYHNVVPADQIGLGDTSLHLPQPSFERQIKIAQDVADVVDLPTLFREWERPGRRVAVTFDDAYRGAVTHALPICAAAGIVPTVFVAPGLFGTTPPWDRLAAEGKWSDVDRERFLTDSRGRDESNGGNASGLPVSYSISDADALRDARRLYPFHIGSHSQTHANLSLLSSRELREELSAATVALSVFGDAVIPFLAYPYGRAPLPDMESILSEFCQAAFLVTGGWISPRRGGATPYRFPRLNVPAGVSERGFKARLNGWV